MIKLDKIGSDPEFGLKDSKGNAIPSFFFFEGTKQFPEDMGGNFAILKDNLLVEGNIPACSTKEEFVDAMKFLKDLIRVPLNVQKAELVSADIMTYEEMWIQTPDGQEFGCSAYRNAYQTGLIDTPQLEGRKRPLGFHIHVSYDNESGYSNARMNKLLTKAMDLFVGIPSDKVYNSKFRRENYGELGAYRETSYGFEYRSLGGYFTQDKYLGWVYDQTIKAIEFCSIRSNLEALENVRSADENYYEELGIDLKQQIPTKKLTKV